MKLRRWPIASVDDAVQTVAHRRQTEVDDQPKMEIRQDKLCVALGAVDDVIVFGRFQLDNQYATDEEVENVVLHECEPLVTHREPLLPLKRYVAELELHAKGLFVDLFEKSRPAQLAVHFDRCSDDLMRMFVRRIIDRNSHSRDLTTLCVPSSLRVFALPSRALECRNDRNAAQYTPTVVVLAKTW